MTNHNDKTIGFILKGYPRLSETFILNEILLLERLGLRLHIIALRNTGETTVHENAKNVRAAVTYIPDHWGSVFFVFIKANVKLWWRKPGVYCSAFGFALRQLNSSTLKRFAQAAYLVENHFVQKQHSHANGNAGFQYIATSHLHAHFSHGPATVAFFAAWLAGKTYSFSAHAKDLYLQERDFLRAKIARARFVVTCTECNRKQLLEIAGVAAPIYRCYHGLNVYAFEVPSPGRTTATPNILSVGRFVPQKGFLVLIEALHLLRQKGFTFYCRLIGDGPLKEEMRRRLGELQLQDCVELIPQMPQEELLKYYRRADLFALACEVQKNGNRDGIPNVLVEAMATAIPVVSTTISGIPELVDDGVNGLLVPERNAPVLAEAMAKILHEPEWARGLGMAGRLKVENEFDALRNVEKIGALLLEAVNGRPISGTEIAMGLGGSGNGESLVLSKNYAAAKLE